jgi:hypothetical protein
MSNYAAADAADSYFLPPDAAWFRLRLAFRLAAPLDRSARGAALKVAGSAALAAPPLVIALIAPAAKLNPGAVFGLCCAGLPGLVITAWTAAGLRETRRLAVRALRQAGAEQQMAWLIAAARLTLFAGLGALAGCLFLTLSHAPLGAVLPKHSPLRGMFVADAPTWLISIALTAMLMIGEALLASSPVWMTVEWSRFAIWRRVSTPAAAWAADVRRGVARLRIRAARGSRPPR